MDVATLWNIVNWLLLVVTVLAIAIALSLPFLLFAAARRGRLHIALAAIKGGAKAAAQAEYLERPGVRV